MLAYFLNACPIALAQVDPALLETAFQILEDRGELVFEFYPDTRATVKQVNGFLSVDRETPSGFRAYANEKGFRTFLALDIPFRLLERQPLKVNMKSSAEFPGNWDEYPTHQQYVSYMEGMAGAYPGICRLDTIGQSVAGRNLLIMKITDHPDEHEPEPAFVYSSTMHGDEPTGYALLLRLIDHLCSNYGRDSLVTRLVDNIEIWINPLANPDGTYFEEEGVPVPKRFNANNVDLNRDFPAVGEGGAWDRSLIQPENLAQMDFLDRIYMVMGANIHSGAEVVNYPFDAWKDLHADNDWYIRISREYADTARGRSFPVLYMSGFNGGITNGWEWYEVHGSRQDWVNYFNHAREVTLEISQRKDHPPSELPYFWYYNYSSMLRYMEHCLYGIHGTVRDGDTGQALEASIRVPGHDKLGSVVYSDSLNGFFARPIDTGTWDLEVSAAGFATEYLSGVQVLPDRATWLDLSLTPLRTVGFDKQCLQIAPNPFVYRTRLIIPVRVTGLHAVCLFDMNGRLVFRDNIFCASKGRHDYSLEAAQLHRGFYILKLVTPTDTYIQKIFKSE